MILGNAYRVLLSASDYNPVFGEKYNRNDSNVKISVKVVDLNYTPIRGKSITLTCSYGAFTESPYYIPDEYMNSLVEVYGYSTSIFEEYTGVTDDKGEFSICYRPSKYGMINIQADTGESIQLNVTHDTGWISFTYPAAIDGGFRAYPSNDSEAPGFAGYRSVNGLVQIRGAFNNIGALTLSSNLEYVQITSIPVEYAPQGIRIYKPQQGSVAQRWLLVVYPSGEIYLTRYGSQDTMLTTINANQYFPFSAEWFNTSKRADLE